MDTTYTGTLQISVVSALGMTPIPGATVTVSYTGDPDSPLETMTTDESGQTPTITLDAPPRELSLSPDITAQPYSEYNIQVTAEGFEPVLVSGSEILAGEFSLQPIRMNPLNVTEEEEKVVVIPAHTLFGEYPPKIPEEEIKPMNETGEIVLSRVVIPEYVIVHDGVPEDPTARNYWVRYKDYIKNVASSEIYSTWPESAIYANILVIQSFTLNRIYTEWYRGRGYDFTITSSTAYDQKWIYGRNVFEEILQDLFEIFDDEAKKKMRDISNVLPKKTDFSKSIMIPNDLMPDIKIPDIKMTEQMSEVFALGKEMGELARMPGIEKALLNLGAAAEAIKIDFVPSGVISVTESLNGTARIAELNGITTLMKKWASTVEELGVKIPSNEGASFRMKNALEKYMDAVRKTYSDLAGYDLFKTYANVPLDELIQVDELIQQNDNEIYDYLDGRIIMPEEEFQEILAEQVKNPDILRRIINFEDELKRKHLCVWILMAAIYTIFISPVVEDVSDKIRTTVCEGTKEVLGELPDVLYNVAEDNAENAGQEQNLLPDIMIPEKDEDESEG